jgi:3-phosphoshikimate 1-carboxyvinyltransferase
MRALISQSNIKGKVSAPSSKSYTIRGLMCAALARGESRIINPLDSDDTEAAFDVLNKLGIQINKDKNIWKVSGGVFHVPDEELYCRESAATLRFMTAICSLVHSTCYLKAAPPLAVRPIKPLLMALRQLGIDCYYEDKEARVVVKGGRLRGGITEIPGDISSQFISALLLVSGFTTDIMKIKVTTPPESQSFIMMTIECLEKFGIKVKHSMDFREFETVKQRYHATDYNVEGDWSSASYLLAAGAVGGETKVGNLNPDSLQGDRVILDFLKEMGASIRYNQNNIIIKKSDLKAIKADLSDCIDLLPTMAVLAAIADVNSDFTGISRARLKESNRVEAVREGLERMGVKVKEEENKLTVTGSPVKGSLIDTRGDHRIAMAFSLIGLICGNTVIENAECVSKTYPEFWETLRGIGGKVELRD